MTLFRDKYRVETTRLKHWDYASGGWYFVTICTRNREHWLGEIVNAEITLSAVGEKADQFWRELPTHFTNIQVDEYVIMPNHMHGILIIVESRQDAPKSNAFGPLRSGSLQAMMNAYKASVTRWCNKNAHAHFAWQPRFYEHIIRTETELGKIRTYIRQNPMKWELEKDNPASLLDVISCL